MNTHIVSLMCLFLMLSGAHGEAWNMRGRLSETVNMKYGEDRAFIKKESWLRCDLTSEAGSAKLFTILDIRYAPLVSRSTELSLQEAYARIRVGPVDFRLGKQVVLWGKADEFNPTDFINPEDYREFISLTRAERKMGIFFPKIDYYVGNYRLECIMIPTFTPSHIPTDSSHPWIPREVDELYHNPRIRIMDEEKPLPRVENAEYAARLSALMSGFDFSLSVYSGYFDIPVMVRTGFLPPDTVIVTPTYKRYKAAGCDFATVLCGWGIRGECAYIHQGYYETESATDLDGIASSPSISFVLGADRSFHDELYLNLQWVERILLSYQEQMIEERIENRLVGSGYRDFFQDEVRVGVSAMVYRITERDYLLHPFLSYTPADGVSLEGGVYLFGGPETSLFGQFSGNDFISFNLAFFF